MKLLPLAILARRLPSQSGRHLHPATLLRWHLNGLKGGTVRLQARKVGGRWCSSRKWLLAFLDACQSPQAVPAVEPPKARSRRLARVNAELDRLGY